MFFLLFQKKKKKYSFQEFKHQKTYQILRSIFGMFCAGMFTCLPLCPNYPGSFCPRAAVPSSSLHPPCAAQGLVHTLLSSHLLNESTDSTGLGQGPTLPTVPTSWRHWVHPLPLGEVENPTDAEFGSIQENPILTTSLQTGSPRSSLGIKYEPQEWEARKN